MAAANSFLATLMVISSAFARDCGFPGRPGNGTTIGAEKFFYPGEEVSFECNNGYILFGGERRTCQEDGTWSGSLPECKYNMALMKTASQSETLWNYDPNLAVDGDTNTCSFTTQSEVQRWWQVHLNGSPRVGSVAITMSPGSYQHFTIFVVQLLEGNKAMYKPCSEFKGRLQEQKVFFKCKEGHSGQFVYIRDDRSDKEYFGLCEVEVFQYKETPECGDPERPIYGIVKVHGEVADYSCIPGYIRKGNATRSCTWSGWRPIAVPECIEVQCNHPPSIKDGFIEVANFKDDYIYGSKATYHCNPGFILWGNTTRLCNANGEWTGSEPKCQPIVCGEPATFPKTSVALINGSTTWKAVAQYSCISGYSFLIGSNATIESICLQNGSWTRLDVPCVPNEQLFSTSPTSDTFLVSTDMKTSLSTPVMLSVIAMIILILASVLAILVILAKKWYIKVSEFSLQHFVISNTKFKDLDAMAGGSHYESSTVSNNCANMPISFHVASNGCVEYLHSNNGSIFGEASASSSNLPARLPRINRHPGRAIESSTLRHTRDTNPLPHYKSNSLRHGESVPDILRSSADNNSTDLSTFSSSAAEDSAFWPHQQQQQQQQKHVIVNQLLTFLTDKQLSEAEQQQNNGQLIGFFNEATSGSTSTNVTLKLSTVKKN